MIRIGLEYSASHRVRYGGGSAWAGQFDKGGKGGVSMSYEDNSDETTVLIFVATEG